MRFQRVAACLLAAGLALGLGACSLIEDIAREIPEILRDLPSDDGGSGSTTQAGDFVFTRQGTFLEPTRSRPSLTIPLDVPPGGSWRRIVVELEVTHGGWFAREPQLNHSIFWLHRAKKWRSNVVGYVNVHGPNRNKMRQVHNLGSGDKMVAEATRLRLREGSTYRFRYVFDGTARTMSTSVNGPGVDATARRSVPFGSVASPQTGNTFFIYFGHEDHTGRGPERPTYGWKYSNLRVEFER